MSNPNADALILEAFIYFMRADRLMVAGDKVARSMGLDVQESRNRFDAMYYDGCQDTSLNAAVYGAYHDAARDEWCAWYAVAKLDELIGHVEPTV